MARCYWGVLLLLIFLQTTAAQPPQTFVLGDLEHPWQHGGGGKDPVILIDPFRNRIDTTNTPGDAIDFSYPPGWIGPLHFDEEENVAPRLLQTGSITAPNAGRGHE